MTTRARFAALASLAIVCVHHDARAQMSDSEKKSAARAAFQEGVALQQQGKIAEALARFQAGEKLYDAPTISVRVAQCQVLLGKLVQGAETYETVTRKNLGSNPPEAFVEAQKQAESELPALRQRIPTLRVTIKPDPSSLQNLHVTENGVQVPVELVGIARPVNPGTYRVQADAEGWATNAPVEVKVSEKEKKSIELVLVQQATTQPTTPTPVAVPAPYYPGGSPQPGVTGTVGSAGYIYPTPKPRSSATGLILGARGGVFIPAGDANGTPLNNMVKAGGGFGLDAILRVQRSLLLGLNFDYAGLSAGGGNSASGNTVTKNNGGDTLFFGASIGILPNIDKVSFIGNVGLGYRSVTSTTELTGGQIQKLTMTGADFVIDGGLSIPAGPLLIVPKLGVSVGDFSKIQGCVDGTCTEVSTSSNNNNNNDNNDSSFHTVVALTLGLYWAPDLGKKETPVTPTPSPTPATTAPSPAPSSPTTPANGGQPL